MNNTNRMIFLTSKLLACATVSYLLFQFVRTLVLVNA